jgi:hypothetical protein
MEMNMRISVAVLGVLIVAGGSASAKVPTERYYNGRFCFSIKYPGDFRMVQPPPVNDDGRRFRSMDGKAEFTASGVYCEGIDEYYQWTVNPEDSDEPKPEVTYKVRKSTWFVVSGYVGRKVFYQKTLASSGTCYTFRIEYDRDAKVIYDKVTEAIVKTFKIPTHCDGG